jgi:aldose 1-epimerase
LDPSFRLPIGNTPSHGANIDADMTAKISLQTYLSASRPSRRRSNVELVSVSRLLVFLLALFFLSARLFAASSHVEPFGKTAKGQPVSQITMTNDRNMRVRLISYGATVTAIEVPDRDGKVCNIVLSLPDMASYERTERRWGGIIGRYAGRIGNARFVLDGKTFKLEPGRNGVTLHGGSDGYDKRVWKFRTLADAQSLATVFTLRSPNGDQGFPGALKLEVTYRLMRASNMLKIEYRAKTSAPTVVNFTNHAFFNLADAGNGTIRDHILTLPADRYSETDEKKIPTGRLLSVERTPLDFRQPTAIGRSLTSDHPLLTPSLGYDHSYAFGDQPSRSPRPIAFVRDPASGRTMAISTTEPGLQFNSGNGFVGKETGSEGVAYPIYAGFALETQHLPDSPNQPLFSSTRLDPGKTFSSVTTYEFATD